MNHLYTWHHFQTLDSMFSTKCYKIYEKSFCKFIKLPFLGPLFVLQNFFNTFFAPFRAENKNTFFHIERTSAGKSGRDEKVEQQKAAAKKIEKQ